MRILLAEADAGLQAAARAVLERDGHEVLGAGDGFQALALVQGQAPDLVLTGLRLPGLDGLELSRLIRLGCRRRIVPVIMFTGPGQEEALGPCLEAGVVEFLPVPFREEELRCRVDSIGRMVRLQQRLLREQARAGEELDLVKHVLARLTGAAAAPGFAMETLATRRINGDACVHREGSPGVHFGLICDATGHGLMAGVSTIPLVETFLGMVARDLPLELIYREINGKLKHLLPTGRFACLLLLRLDAVRGILAVLNAGMPDVLLRRATGEVLGFPSRVLPAGIAAQEDEAPVQCVTTAPGDRVLACSDGFGELFGPEALRANLAAQGALSHEEHCRVLRERALGAGGSREQRDDVSWALWEVPEPSALLRGGAADRIEARALVPGFEAAFTLDPRQLPARELLPHLHALLRDFRLNPERVQLFAMLVAEALTNAVDHGLLGLDSAIKAQGFAAYDQHRARALEALGEGGVRLTLTLLVEAGGDRRLVRRVRAEVADTGPGFPWRAWLAADQDPGLRPYGRGLALLAGLGRDLTFNEKGNTVCFAMDFP